MDANYLRARNNAPTVNGYNQGGRTADIHITTHGSDFYYAICAVMGVSTFLVLFHAMRKPGRHRVFHYILAAVLATSTIAYYSMGSNLGFTPIPVEFVRRNPKVAGILRQIFYVRYIQSFITASLILLALLLVAGSRWSTILWMIFMGWIMIVCGLVGALVQTRYKWGYFAFGCAALLYIIYKLLLPARRKAALIGNDVGRAYLPCAAYISFLWLLYPIAWGLSEGGNVIAPDSEAVFYGVLDFLSKPVFAALLLWQLRKIDFVRFRRLGSWDYDRDGEKRPHPHTGVLGANGTNGAAATVPATHTTATV